MKKNTISSALIPFLLLGCSVGITLDTNHNQQHSRIYNTTSTKKILKETAKTLKSEGYQIKNTDKALGVVIAEQIKKGPTNYTKTTINANINRLPKQTKIYLSATEKIISPEGHTIEITTIKNPKFYQKIFTQLETQLQN